jgi:HTH-type transcriptional regulator/antitoxin HigA
MSGSVQTTWEPDWAVHPGEHLAEYIEERGYTQAEFARLAGLTAKLVSTIVNGTNPVSPETAIKLERVLGLKAHIWTGLQAQWDLFEARRRENEKSARDWLRAFPVKELKALRRLPDTRDEGVLVDGLLSFLGIGTQAALQARIGSLAVQHRKARSGSTSQEHELCWLVLGEQKVRQEPYLPFDREAFVEGCRSIRGLTVENPEVFEPKMIDICRSSGVTLVFQKPLSKTCLFGSARWIDGERPIIQMSLRMKSNDHFWWTFFHEAAHIVLHKGKNFADDQSGVGDGIETEADAWAEEALVGRDCLNAFVTTNPRSKDEILAFASSIGVHPGIIVGMLQHRRVIPFSHMNGLKVQFELMDESV